VVVPEPSSVAEDAVAFPVPMLEARGVRTEVGRHVRQPRLEVTEAVACLVPIPELQDAGAFPVPMPEAQGARTVELSHVQQPRPVGQEAVVCLLPSLALMEAGRPIRGEQVVQASRSHHQQ
jgi:hypothetical protein